MNRSLQTLCLALCCLCGLMTFAQHTLAAGYDRPSGDAHQSRSAVISRNGMVATSQPLATLAGLDALRQGGTAADAAIAANAVIGLVEPMSCGIGGDLFAIYWDSKTQKLYGLNASGRSPYSLTREHFKQLGLKYIPQTGPDSWSVPGCVSGWELLRQRFGSWDYGRLLAAAIEHAEQGFPVSELISHDWNSAAGSLKRYPDTAKTYLPNGRGPQVGEVFRNPYLAASYRALAQEGAAAFYTGSIARQIAEFSGQVKGHLTLRDLAEHTAEWVEPVAANYRGYDVWELPPNGQGIAALQMLNVLERHDLKPWGPQSAEYLHLFVEAKKLAFADRALHYHDPAFGNVPVAELISKPYAARRAAMIDMARAMHETPAGDPRLEKGDTIYLTVVDKDRNCCSLIQSNFYGFGSMLVPGDAGFVLQNRGCLFALDDEHPNRLEPHKRPFHTIIPAMMTKEGKPWLTFGVMGGDMQPQGHVQIVVNMIDFGMNVQQAGDAARIRHFGSAEPTGRPAAAEGGSVVMESGFPDEALIALRAKGHRVERGKGDFGGYQAIHIDWQHGTLHGASEARKDGCAMGY